MRLFVALDLPAAVREALAGVELGEGWRRVPPESLHVTLAFLGTLSEEGAADAVVRAVGSAMRPIGRLASMEGVLLPVRRPRVVAVRLAGEMGELQASVARALAAAGLYEPERRAFLPHVTIGRARGERVSRSLPAVPAVSFTAPSVTVYRSLLSPKGARYEALASFPVMSVASEAAVLRSVRLAALADAPGAFMRTLAEAAALGDAWWSSLAARSAAGETDRVFLAPDGGGMAGGHREGEDVQLWGMWVAPALRGTGLGRSLLRAVVGWARSVGAARVVLSVRDGVPGAGELYASEGFAPVGRSGDQLHLALALPPSPRT